jgi:hypothetical protein
MSNILTAGIILVNLALLSYSAAIIRQQRQKIVSSVVLTFLTLGIALDVSATICMIIGSSNSFITFHGIIGYLALLAMVIDGILLWNHKIKKGPDKEAGHRIHLYSRYAYIWWVVAYITGAVIVFAG